MNAASGAARIVIVDDDDLFRESLGLNLIDEGYEVTSFSGGQAALEYFAAGGRLPDSLDERLDQAMIFFPRRLLHPTGYVDASRTDYLHGFGDVFGVQATS